MRYLKWVTEGVLSDLTAAEDFAYAISALILSDSAKRSEDFQRALRSFAQNHKRLGDPRLRESSLNWRPIASEAAQRYLSWLARDNIIFFFNTILPNTNENRRRKDFWLRYHDRIRDFQVAVSEADLWKVKASQKNSEVLHYSHVAHPTTSAFLMRFEGYGEHFLIVGIQRNGKCGLHLQDEGIRGTGDHACARIGSRWPVTSSSTIPIELSIGGIGNRRHRTGYRRNLASGHDILHSQLWQLS